MPMIRVSEDTKKRLAKYKNRMTIYDQLMMKQPNPYPTIDAQNASEHLMLRWALDEATAQTEARIARLEENIHRANLLPAAPKKNT